MKQNVKQMWIVILAIACVFTATFTVFAGCSEKENYSWTIGSTDGSIKAYFSDNGKYGFILNVEGNGSMSDFASPKDAPWYGKSGRITEIRIAEGIKSVGANAFTDVKTEAVIIPKGLKTVGNAAFNENTFLCVYEEVAVPQGVKVLTYSATAPGEEGKFWHLRDGKPVVWQTLKVLFIGNSFTFYSDIPALFGQIAREAGESVVVESVTQGAWTLTKFADETDEFGKIADEKLKANDDYDAVVLQEQSTRPLDNYDGFLSAVKAFKNKIAATQKACKIYLYSTWGYPEEAANRRLTVVEMEQRIRTAYENAASAINAKVSYVGAAFSKVYTEHPELNLYYTDNKHPSYTGAFLSASVHVATILGIDPRSSAFVGELDADTAAILKEASYEIVLK